MGQCSPNNLFFLSSFFYCFVTRPQPPTQPITLDLQLSDGYRPGERSALPHVLSFFSLFTLTDIYTHNATRSENGPAGRIVCPVWCPGSVKLGVVIIAFAMALSRLSRRQLHQPIPILPLLL